MMYMGGKSRIAKEITKVMLELSDKREVYVEPFLGGGAVAEHMCPHFEHKYLSDMHEDLMLMWDAVINQDWVPPTEVSYELYQELKYSNEPSPLRGFVGYACSFGGKWFGGYARNNKECNYAQSGYNVVLRKAKGMSGSKCSAASYSVLPVVPNTPLIYCDPPYADTTSYSTGSFDSAAFWAKAQEWAEKGADVFVSEYAAPEGWDAVWEKEVVGQLDNRKERTKPTEKLFRWVGK